jgi:5-methylcytosine-specific restriction enzyme A
LNTNELFDLFIENNYFSSKEIELFQAIYYFPKHSARASDIYLLLGYKHYAPVNILVGKLGKKIAQSLKIPLSERYNGTYKGWDILFRGETAGNGGWLWTLKQEFVLVLEKLHLVEEIFTPTEIAENNSNDYFEGSYKIGTRIYYERNPLARKKCLEHYGFKCWVCGFDFYDKYGNFGLDYIEVHHVTPISLINEEYSVDPINDLRPVCSNCHSIIHRKKESTVDINELKAFLEKRYVV